MKAIRSASLSLSLTIAILTGLGGFCVPRASASTEHRIVESIETLTGRIYKQCRITQVHPDGISMLHASGAAKILFTDLAQEWRDRFGYDPGKAAAYERDLREQREAERERLLRVRAGQAEARRLQDGYVMQWFERMARIEMERERQMLSALAATGVGGLAPLVGWGGADIGPVSEIIGPPAGWAGWRRDRGARGWGLGWGPGIWGAGFGGWGAGHAGWCGPVWHRPAIVTCAPVRFAPLCPPQRFGGVSIGGARAANFSGAMPCAPLGATRGTISVPMRR
jgi:hypothetical protein